MGTYRCSLLHLALLTELIHSQVVVRKTLIEDVSINVDILCGLDRQFRPLYWDIQGRVYDLYSVPSVFSINEDGDLRIATVDRRIDGWRFQCFTVDPNNEEWLNPGQITIVAVIYGGKLTMHKINSFRDHAN